MVAFYANPFEVVMKQFACSAALAAGVMALCGFSHDANAVTVNVDVISQDIVSLPSPSVTTPIANSVTGNVEQGVSGSVSGERRSPFEDAATQTIPALYANTPYTSVSSPAAANSTATYNFSSPVNTLTFLWGSPDSYNTLSFYSGANGTGLLGSLTGDSPILIQTLGHDLVTLQLDGGLDFSSVVFSSTQAAFEFAGLSATETGNGPGETPLPATLPLFASGLGVMGLLGWRKKKRKNSAAIAAA